MTAATERQRITADDLYRIDVISEVRLSPDGEQVVFARQWVDRKKQKKYQNLWLLSARGGEPHQLTVGKHRDSKPRWSPDGSKLAFISNRLDEDQPQIFWIPMRGGGEGRPLTEDFKGSFGDLEWSPEGDRLAFSFRKKDPEAIERQEDPDKKELGIVCRHIRRTFYKLDGEGFLPDERWHLWTIDLEGEARQLTDGDIHDERQPAWSPDGRWLAYVSNITDEPDLDPEADELFIIPSDGGEPRRLDLPLGFKAWPRFSPDGSLIAWVGKKGVGEWWRNNRLFVTPVRGGSIGDLTGDHDLNVNGWTIGDVGGFESQPPTWSSDGTALYFTTCERGGGPLRRVGLDDGRMEPVIDHPGAVLCYSIDAGSQQVAWLHGSFFEPFRICCRTLPAGDVRTLLRPHRELLEELEPGELESLTFEGGAGNEVHGWILKPPGFDESDQYPSVLEIHGGPRVQYGNVFMHEFLLLAAQGYVVYFCNPRGSQGYGEEHSQAIWNDWGGADYQDLMAFCDVVHQRPYIDTDRLGVTGGSYGGYMTNWIIGHTDRFQAAVTQRCVSNMISMYGSSDFNWFFQREFGDVPPWEAFESYWRQSPMKYIGNATTPTLVIHSENDLRCDMEQGEQVFVALKRLGVDTELVRFPDEPHGLSRGGRTDRRIARLEHILRWFDRYLRPEDSR